MKRKILGLILLFGLGIMGGGAVWAQGYTINDVMKETAGLKADLAALQVKADSVGTEINRLYTIVLALFGSIAAMIAGLCYFVFDISRSLRVPKEDRVAKLEGFMERAKEQLRIIDEKLHLPRSVL